MLHTYSNHRVHVYFLTERPPASVRALAFSEFESCRTCARAWCTHWRIVGQSLPAVQPTTLPLCIPTDTLCTLYSNLLSMTRATRLCRAHIVVYPLATNPPPTREPRFPWNPSSLQDSDCFSKRVPKKPTVPRSDPPLAGLSFADQTKEPTVGNEFCEEEGPRGKCYEKPRFPSIHWSWSWAKDDNEPTVSRSNPPLYKDDMGKDGEPQNDEEEGSEGASATKNLGSSLDVQHMYDRALAQYVCPGTQLSTLVASWVHNHDVHSWRDVQHAFATIHTQLQRWETHTFRMQWDMPPTMFAKRIEAVTTLKQTLAWAIRIGQSQVHRDQQGDDMYGIQETANVCALHAQWLLWAPLQAHPLHPNHIVCPWIHCATIVFPTLRMADGTWIQDTSTLHALWNRMYCHKGT